MNSYEIAKKAALGALNKKATDVLIMDLKKVSTMTDYFVICSGDVDVQVKAIADEIRRELKKDVRPWHVEGYQNLTWVLMDYVDVVVHVFQKEIRDYYNLEKLWGDAPVERITDEAGESIPATK